MFRILQFTENRVQVSTDPGQVRPPGAEELCWIDVQDFAAPDLELLQQRFGFHPLAIEDCLNHNERAKLDDYTDYLFLVMHQLAASKGPTGFHTEELDMFLGRRYLVTIHRQPSTAVEKVWTRAAGDHSIAVNGMDFLCYLLIDELVDWVFPLLDNFSEQIEGVETAVLARPDNSQLRHLLRFRRMLIMLRRVLAPQRDLAAILVRRGDERISERTGLFFRDIYDHLMRAAEQLEFQRDQVSNVMEAYMSMVANRTNEVMKRLTVLASIFLPLNFMTGFFGQNFDLLPNASHVIFALDLAGCILLPVGMLFWLRRHEWF
jgi:magnesium transporter